MGKKSTKNRSKVRRAQVKRVRRRRSRTVKRGR